MAISKKKYTAKELKLLEDKAKVLDYIAGQSVGSMKPLILHWYPTCPPITKYPKVKPFTALNPCTCIDVTGYLDAGEHFDHCRAIKSKK